MFQLIQEDQLLGIERLPSGRYKIVGKTSWLYASYETDLDYDQLNTWALGVQELLDFGAGAYLFDAQSNCLRVEFAMGKRGDFHVSVNLQNAPDYLNEVRLVFRLLQDQLPALIAGIESLVVHDAG